MPMTHVTWSTRKILRKTNIAQKKWLFVQFFVVTLEYVRTWYPPKQQVRCYKWIDNPLQNDNSLDTSIPYSIYDLRKQNPYAC